MTLPGQSMSSLTPDNLGTLWWATVDDAYEYLQRKLAANEPIRNVPDRRSSTWRAPRADNEAAPATSTTGYVNPAVNLSGNSTSASKAAPSAGAPAGGPEQRGQATHDGPSDSRGTKRTRENSLISTFEDSSHSRKNASSKSDPSDHDSISSHSTGSDASRGPESPCDWPEEQSHGCQDMDDDCSDNARSPSCSPVSSSQKRSSASPPDRSASDVSEEEVAISNNAEPAARSEAGATDSPFSMDDSAPVTAGGGVNRSQSHPLGESPSVAIAAAAAAPASSYSLSSPALTVTTAACGPTQRMLEAEFQAKMIERLIENLRRVLEMNTWEPEERDEFNGRIKTALRELWELRRTDTFNFLES